MNQTDQKDLSDLGKAGKGALKIRLSDVFRATLAEESGNLGFVGLAPDGAAYHVVVPVDIQIARGGHGLQQARGRDPLRGLRRVALLRVRPLLRGPAHRRGAARGQVVQGRGQCRGAGGLGRGARGSGWR